MPLDARFLRVVDRFLDLIRKEVGFDTIVCDETGTIVRATLACRVGTSHPYARKIMRHEIDEYFVTAAEAAADPALREGMNCPIAVGGRRVGTFGIAGKEAMVKPLARLASVLLANWLEELERDAAPQTPAQPSSRRGRVLWIHGSDARWRESIASLSDAYDVLDAASEPEGLARVLSEAPDVVLCERAPDDGPPPELSAAMKRDRKLRGVPLILLDASAHEIAKGCRRGADACFGGKFLRGQVAAAMQLRHAFDALEAEHESLGRMITHSARSEARLRAVIESALDGIVLLGRDGKVQGLNAAAEQMFGLSQEEAAGRDFLEAFVAPSSRDAVAEAMQRRGSRRRAAGAGAVLRGLRRGGEEFPFECNFTRLELGSSAGQCAFVRDITEPQRLQLELQQAQKLEAVGQLAAGIAHEINSPIQFIGDNTQFVQEALAAFDMLLERYAEAVPPETRERMRRLEEEVDLPYLREHVPSTIDRTLQGVQRVATIVRAMKEFAHPDQREMVATDLNRAIQATLEVARNEYKYVAVVETDLAELPLVVCYPGELNQVFLNILVNAAHAIGDVVKGTQEKGKIRVATRRDGEDVVVTISDTGTGIPEAIRHKVYDPFFTTKGVGRGTGQGLAIAHNIVTRHRGTLGFDTAPGRGTTFFVRIPIEGVGAGVAA